MQKKLIALALASLAGSAFAQSNVTVYGVADASFEFVKTDDGVVDNAGQGSMTRFANNASYIGFKGAEDLGNGLKAVFQFEQNVNIVNGSGLVSSLDTNAARDTYVGLAGSFGTVVVGNLTHGLRAMSTKVDILPGMAGVGTTNSVTGTILGVKTGADDRAKNAVAYISPDFSGFSFIGAYTSQARKLDSDQTGAESQNATAYQLYGQYANGPLYVALGYHVANDTLTNGVDPLGVVKDGLSPKATVWRAAASYTFPTNTTVSALYDSTKIKVAGFGIGDEKLKRNAWSLGVNQAFGKHTVGAQYARSGNVSGDVAVALGADNDSDAKIWTLAYHYDLSKRTMVKAYYSQISNGDNNGTSFYNNAVSPVVGGTTGFKATAFGLGLRHSF